MTRISGNAADRKIVLVLHVAIPAGAATMKDAWHIVATT
jgi:hypothetical protein